MKLPVTLNPIDRRNADALILMLRDGSSVSYANRAIFALKRLAASIQTRDLLAHAATQGDGAAWLCGVESVLQAAHAQVEKTRAVNDDLMRADGLRRHQHDSAAMTLVSQARASIYQWESYISASRRQVEDMKKLLLIEGITFAELGEKVARRSFGVADLRVAAIQEEIVSARARLAGIHTVLSAAAHAGDALQEATLAEMNALKEKLEADIANHQKQLSDEASEAAHLGRIAQQVGLEADGPQELLLNAVGRAERGVAMAQGRIEAEREVLTSLEDFLGDPLRDLTKLVPKARGRLIELSGAAALAGTTEVPRSRR